ncbi:hypothetical protein HB4184_00435 [Pseudomonas putida]|nr:hypothetical protein HB4184_00435 [Pseudomonas putida]
MEFKYFFLREEIFEEESFSSRKFAGMLGEYLCIAGGRGDMVIMTRLAYLRVFSWLGKNFF